MKYSLIIVAFKAQEALVRCLESLAEHPPEKNEAEIIIVDNSPETIQGAVSNDLLKRLMRDKYLRVIFAWDGRNLGFAEGCNEGARHANGQNLVFINPDTCVFEGWAEKMLFHMRPEVGAIGPISNFVAGIQNADLHMQIAETWEKTAAFAAKGNAGRGVATKLLIGFFLMMSRKVWDAIGGMDPQFFLGCDDLDLSLRLRDAGYELIIASDVFVYHEGHVSFYASGEAAMAHNKRSEKALLAKLAAKYSDGIPSSSFFWGCEILPTRLDKRMTLSVCMIAYDGEQDNLLDLVPQLGFADQVIICNTGTIRFRQWLDTYAFVGGEQWGDKPRFEVYDFPWCDNFASARNFALSKCSKDWAIWLDPDDRVPKESAQLIRAAMDFPGPLTADKKVHFSLRLRDKQSTGHFKYIDQPRIFPRLEGMEWTGRVHEGYMPAADKLGLKLVSTGIIIDHTGYADAEVMKTKHARNLRLLAMEPESPLQLYQMGQSCSGLGDFDQGRAHWKAILSKDWGSPLLADFIAQIRYTIALSYYMQDQVIEAMDEWLIDNQKPDSIFLRAERALREKEYEEALSLYQLYASYGPIMDYYGTDQEAFQAASLGRIELIESHRVPA